MIEIRTLGGLSIHVDGKLSLIRARKHAALLVYLRIQDAASVSRESLSSLLWDSSDSSRARHCLSQALYDLRKNVPALPLELTSSHVTLKPESVWLDLSEFWMAFQKEDFASCLKLYRGPFLEGLNLPGRLELSDWQERVSARVEREHSLALVALLSDAETAGRWADVLSLSELALARDELDEESHSRRIKAMAALGNIRAALVEHDRVNQLIETESGSPPTANFLSLRTVLDRFPAPSAAEGTAVPIGSTFVGRSNEYRRLQQAWASSSAGVLNLSVITGPAGIGKTRLAEEFQRGIQLAGARVLAAKCFESERRLPYGVVAELLGEPSLADDITALAPFWRKAICRLLPTIESEPVSPGTYLESEEVLRPQLYEGVVHLIKETCKRLPVAIVIDDAQWMDDSTAELLHYVLRHSANQRLLLLLTARAEELRTNRAAELLMSSEYVDSAVQTFPLRELTSSDVDCVIAGFVSEYNVELGFERRKAIESRAGGHPFLLLAMLRWLTDNECGDILRDVKQSFTAVPASPGEVPPDVERFLDRQVRALSADARDLVALLAAFGKDVPRGLLLKLSGQTLLQYGRVAEELITASLIHERNGCVAFTHDLFREAAYRLSTPVRRRALHSHIAAVLDRQAELPAVAVCHHYHLAGARKDAFRTAVAAADAALAVFAYPEAEELLRIALFNSDHEVDRSSLQFRLGELLFRIRRYAEAEELLETVVNSGKATGRRQLLRVQVMRLYIAAALSRMPASELIRQLTRVLPEVAEQPDLLSLTLKGLTITSHFSGEVEHARKAADELLALSRKHRRTGPGIDALRAGAAILASYDNPRRSYRLAKISVAWAQAVGDPVLIACCSEVEGLAAYMCGNAIDGLEALSRAITIAGDVGASTSLADFLNQRGILRHEAGDFSGARRDFLDRMSVGETAIIRDVHLPMINLAMLAWEQADLEECRKYATRLLANVEGESAWFSCVVGAHAFLGLVALENGAVLEARNRRSAIRRIMDRHPLRVGDFSYPEMFLARLAVLEGHRESALAGLDAAIEQYAQRDTFCRWKLQLERARLSVDQEPERARQVAHEIRERAARAGARPHVERAESVLARAELRLARS